jgi:hypothetical protein
MGSHSRGRSKREPCLRFVARLLFENGLVPSSSWICTASITSPGRRPHEGYLAQTLAFSSQFGLYISTNVPGAVPHEYPPRVAWASRPRTGLSKCYLTGRRPIPPV